MTSPIFLLSVVGGGEIFIHAIQKWTLRVDIVWFSYAIKVVLIIVIYILYAT